MMRISPSVGLQVYGWKAKIQYNKQQRMPQFSNCQFWLQIIIQDRQLVVSMTGFVHDPALAKYQEMLEQLGCKYADQLSHDVDYLIVNHTCTEKYKIAELDRSSTESITLKWLQDSFRNKKMLPIDKYKVKKVFYGVRAIMEGFDDKQMLQKVKDVLQSNGAEEVREGVQGMQAEQLNQKYQLIIVPNMKLYKRLEAKVAQFLMIPLVTPEWLQQSMRAKKCKYPNDYALNYHNICTRQFNDCTNIRRLNRKLATFMEMDFLSTPGSSLLCDKSTGEQLIVYLDANSIDHVSRDLLRKLICVNGGLCLNTYGPVVTHILVGAIQETEFHKFMNYGDSSHILRVEWLIDTILFSQKLPEADFKVRSFKTPLIKSMTNLQIREVHYQRNHSQTFVHSYNGFNEKNMVSLPSQLQRKPSKNISISKDPIVARKVVEVTKVRAIKSDIFKGRYFYIEKTQKKQPIMQSVYTKIKENGGIPLSQNSLAHLKNKKMFVVLKDSQKNQVYLQEINKMIEANGMTLVPISVRWVEECIKKASYIDYNAQNHFIFKPFLFETPLRELMCMKVELLGVEQILKRRYKQLLIALGTNKVSPNICQITHCLCSATYEADPRYQAILSSVQAGDKQKEREKQTVSKQSSAVKGNGSLGAIKFVKVEWLIELLNSKPKANIEDYTIKVIERVE